MEDFEVDYLAIMEFVSYKGLRCLNLWPQLPDFGLHLEKDHKNRLFEYEKILGFHLYKLVLKILDKQERARYFDYQVLFARYKGAYYTYQLQVGSGIDK